MNILCWIVGLGLIAFEAASGIGKLMRSKMAVDAMTRIGMSDPMMMAFGGLEMGAAGVILFSLFNRSGPNEGLVPWAGGVIIILMGLMLALQFQAGEPTAAKVGPIVVIALAVAFLFLRRSI